MSSHPELVLFSTDVVLTNALKKRFMAQEYIRVVLGTGPEVSGRMQLDALWMTPMQASYFGVGEAIPLHTAKVFKMPQERKEKGLPRLIVAGVNLAPTDPRTPHFLANLCIDALYAAISRYNQNHPDPILRVGSIPENLGLDDLDDLEAFSAVKNRFEQPEVGRGLSQTKTHRRIA